MMESPFDLKGKSVLITGASSGLGRATAILASRLGARVLLVARNLTRLRETYAALDGQGHAMLSMDLFETDAIPQMVTDQASAFGAFSGVVHSAGVVLLKPLRACRTVDYESLYRVNVVAAAQLLRGLSSRRGVIDEKGCSTVLVGSVMSNLGKAGLCAYAASKAATLGLVRCAALELARDNIRVNAILPGHFKSGMSDLSETQLLPEQLKSIAAMHPLGVGRADDVANAVAFLLSDGGRWITGSSIVVDGGYSVE
jgi:NAD(P)-dependent dehydrogenase (short-subunit alcohol dehydrogenase family)